MRVLPCLLSLLLLLFLPAATADVTPGGSGIIYGPDNAFSLTAPEGWSLDNASAAKQGIHAVFFPEDSSWAESTVVAYATSRRLDEQVKTVEDFVKSVLADFHAKGHPDYEGAKDSELEAESGSAGIIYKYQGDKWGNFEAVCYFKEDKTINFIVMSSRDKEAFDGAWKSFLALCKSYTFITDQVDIQTPKRGKATDVDADSGGGGKDDKPGDQPK